MLRGGTVESKFRFSLAKRMGKYVPGSGYNQVNSSEMCVESGLKEKMRDVSKQEPRSAFISHPFRGLL